MNHRILTPVVSAIVALAAIPVSAQQPAPAPAPAPEAAAQPAVTPPAAGRGGRGGVPGTTLAGGPNLSDAAYANILPTLFPKVDPVLPKSPADELKEFLLQPGYSLQLVLSDPIIQEPTAVSFDANGRMFVLEDRGYMKTVDAQRQRDPISRISLHEDTNNDGVYDKHSVFVDNLVFPRFVTPFGPNTILTMETDQGDVWKYTDTNNDGKADKRELFTTGMGRSGNVEHQPSFLTWTMDNWMYSTYNTVRIRWNPTGGVLRETVGTNNSAWGVTQDNDGKQWFQGGASGMPGYFQLPVAYGNFPSPDQIAPETNIPWGAPVRIADMQGGLATVRFPDGSLRSTTAGAGNDIVRAHRMPADLQGNYLYGEPVARIVRRLEPVVSEGVTQLKNHYIYNEFIKSTDPLFRPVDMATAPDGSIYIVDMYRGIIQEAQWAAPEGTYLRARVDQYQLDKVHSLGRIWRLTYTGMPRDTTVPRMNNQSAAQLVAHLSHPNGWWRDTAQQLLILKQDKAVVPALQRVARSTENANARLHAIWTLEGLGSLDAALTRSLLKDANPRVRVQAVRASETLYKGGDKSFAADYATLARDADASVAMQALMTMNTLRVPDATTVAKAVQEANKARGVALVANGILNPPAADAGGAGLTGPAQASHTRGRAIYAELCATCHGANALGEPKPGGGNIAPSLSGSPRVNGHSDYIANVLLRGLTGPLPGISSADTDLMVPMHEQNDQWIADVATYVRNSFGNTGAPVTAAQVARIRAATASRTKPWTLAELEPRLPRQLTSAGDWKTTASHNQANSIQALSQYNTWTANAAQAPGPIWLQIELTAPAVISGVDFNLPAPGAGGRGGGGGRGGAAGGRGGGQVAPPVVVPAVAPADLPPAAQPAAAPVAPVRTLRLEVSTNGTDWTPVATGEFTEGIASLALNQPASARFVRISQPSGPQNLALGALRVYEAGPAR